MTETTATAANTANDEQSSVLTEVRGSTGIITLNRPKALNALNHDMVHAMTDILTQWRDDEAISQVILRGAGERALCAGGDIGALYEDAKAGGTEGATFWKDEYELNHLIATYPKPYIAFQTGFVLGGGIGISAHGSHRIVTDSSRLGMPEVGIGFSPDVGGSFLLNQSPDRLGRHAAYTGGHFGAAEAIALNLADTYVPEDQLDALVDALVAAGTPAAIAEFAQDIEPGFGADRAQMVEVYAADTLAETVARLEKAAAEDPEGWASAALKKIRRNSALGLRVTERSIDRGAGVDLAQALSQEFWMAVNMQRHPEFVEGVRAQIIDKDRNPAWTYPDIDSVPAEVVEDLLRADTLDVSAPSFTQA